MQQLFQQLLAVFVDFWGVQFLDTVFDMPVVVHVRVRRAENCGCSAVAVLVQVVDVFFVQFIDGVDVPVLMQRCMCSLGHSR